MENGYLGEEECAVLAVYASGEVEILGVHEIPLIEKADVLKSADAQEHEATRKAWNIHHVTVSRVCQFVSLVALGEHTFRQEHSAEHIYGSGQKFGQRLYVAIEEEHLGHDLSYLAVLFHVLPDGWYDV